MCNFKTRLEARGYPKNLIESMLSEVSFAGRPGAKKQTKQTKCKIMSFVTTYHLGVKNLKQILMQKWSLIQNQPLLKTIYNASYYIIQKRKSLKRYAHQSKTLEAHVPPPQPVYSVVYDLYYRWTWRTGSRPGQEGFHEFEISMNSEVRRIW